MISDDLLADVIAEAVHRATVQLQVKIAALEARPVIAPDVIDLLTENGADLRSRLIALEAQAPMLAKIESLEKCLAHDEPMLDRVIERVAALETRAPVPGPMGPAGPAGSDGKDGVSIPGERGPIGERGERGERGEKGLAGIGEKGDRGDQGERGEPGLAGKDGESLIGPMGLQGERGEPGLAGKDGIGLVGPRGERGEIGPVGQTGKDGATGLAGKDGAPGKDVDMVVVQQSLETLVTKAIGMIPPAKDGQNGSAGRDGLGLTSAVVDRDGHLVLTLSDGSTKDVGIVMGKDGRDGLQGKDVDMAVVERVLREAVDAIPRPKDGKDGADGLGFDDADLVFAESTGYTLRLAQGDRVKDWPIPIPFYAGVWRSGTYPKGACVTHQGGQWTAVEATSARPGDEGAASRAWRLSVKGGKDGKPGPPGRDGSSG